MSTRLIRAKALLLLLVFLAAGTSLPSLDSLLFHQDADHPSRSLTHVEPAGGCLDHAEHCVLGRTATVASSVATPTVQIRLQPAGGPVGRPTSKSLQSAEPAGTPHSRAPPVLIV